MAPCYHVHQGCSLVDVDLEDVSWLLLLTGCTMLCGDLAQQTCFEHSLPIRHCAAYQRQTGEENAMR